MELEREHQVILTAGKAISNATKGAFECEKLHFHKSEYGSNFVRRSLISNIWLKSYPII